jgi:hypothetical protein
MSAMSLLPLFGRPVPRQQRRLLRILVRPVRKREQVDEPRLKPSERASGGKIAHFKRIEWHIIADASTASATLQTNEMYGSAAEADVSGDR